MPRLLIALTLLLMADLAPAAENTLTPAEKRGGWKLLFDGKTTEGWRNYREKSIHPEWEVVDGAMTKSKSEAGNIVTKDKYGSFELSLE